MVIKEIWGYLLAYNLIRLLMMQAAILAGILPREISFKHSLKLWLIWSRQTNTSHNHMLWVVCELMAQQRVGNRSGRTKSCKTKTETLSITCCAKRSGEGTREKIWASGEA
jgi:hypothetical protein